ncbi:hypothetical protein CLU79DRAFT_890307 [Phycomyces nitens]|nr:hypothetical protein CLU79DRAFT_890307 [Phycomyces nitens]
MQIFSIQQRTFTKCSRSQSQINETPFKKSNRVSTFVSSMGSRIRGLGFTKKSSQNPVEITRTPSLNSYSSTISYKTCISELSAQDVIPRPLSAKALAFEALILDYPEVTVHIRPASYRSS